MARSVENKPRSRLNSMGKIRGSRCREKDASERDRLTGASLSGVRIRLNKGAILDKLCSVISCRFPRNTVAAQRGPVRSTASMALTAEQVARIAHLARLQLPADEQQRVTDSLNNILGLI